MQDHGSREQSLSDEDTREQEDSSTPLQNFWHVRAACLSIAFIVLSFWGTSTLRTADAAATPDLLVILGSLLCFHVVGTVTIIAVLLNCVPAGRRLSELNMDKGYSIPTLLQSLKYSAFIIPAVLAINVAVLILFRYMQWPIQDDPIIEWLSQARVEVVVPLVIGAVVIAPVAEELMFRLVLYESIAGQAGQGIAIGLTSLLFALSHLQPTHVMPLFVLAIVLQYARNRSRNIWLPISIHAFFNGFMVAVTLLFQPN